MKRYFSRDGDYLGFKDSEGRYFRADGEYVGYKDPEGRFFDSKGELRIREEDDDRAPHRQRCPRGHVLRSEGPQ